MSANDFRPEDLPNRFDFAEAQPRVYAQWEKEGDFNAEPDPNRQPFSIVIPPPNVTGALHLGHALNNTLQDVQIRMRRMQGYSALWMPGTDHAGIATQAVVERRLREEEGKTRHDLGREALVSRIWKWKEQYEDRILGQLKRMGCSCDWRRTRFTLDDQCARAVRTTFFGLFAKGLIYRGKRLVNWDTHLQTAVSDDEVFQEKSQGHFWHIRYPLVDRKAGEPEYLTVATTRPETLLGDTAVAVHPDPEKRLAEVEQELSQRLEKAPAKEREELQSQLDAVKARRETHLPLLIQLSELARQGRRVLLPLLKREIPLVADEWAKPEMGSGCVKITPAHDPNDYVVGARQNLPMINLLNADGTLNASAGVYEGLTIQQARKRVVADLESDHLLEKVEDREIELPHSDRSKTPIEPRLADQWFVKMDQLAQSAMDAVTSGRITIHPSRYTRGYLDWLGEKRDWPVSRQLWWGHQIPIWTKLTKSETETKELVKVLEADPAFKSGALRFQSQPFWERETAEKHKQPIDPSWPFHEIHVCLAEETGPLPTKLESLGFRRDPDVLDTWFSSALWPHSTLGWPEKTPELNYFYPTSVLITSRDIITLWVARMVLTGLTNVGDVPFKEVFIHPKILDGYGETMSKSKGNGVDPIDVIDKFGADALRFGLVSLTTETQDVRMPVQFECPHCAHLLDQTKGNRESPKIACPKCSKEFSTQWARTEGDKALPRGAVVSERFEVARNFSNKLWNAARFSLINLQGYQPGEIDSRSLTVEDRWILSRLATVTKEVTESLQAYHYAEAGKAIYDFAWDEFCSFYIEIAKPRFQVESTKAHAQRMLAHTLDTLLRLMHPIMPFITEEIWELLGRIAPERGLPSQKASARLIRADWPTVGMQWIDPTMEASFKHFQAALASLREIRTRQNISNRTPVRFSIQCSSEMAELLKPMAPYFASMANAESIGWGATAAVPTTHAKSSLPNMEIYVDLEGHIDVAAEITKNRQLEQKLLGLIQGKESKLANESFVSRAPANVVSTERESLTQAKQQLESVRAALASLQKQ